jgi:fluoride ion exporter CrcB/FEX
MAESSYSLTKIHLPENKSLIRFLRKVSILINLAALLFGFAILFFSPIVGIVFTLAVAPLFVEGKLDPFYKHKSRVLKILYLLFSIACSLLVVLAGIAFVFGFSLAYVKQINLSIGFSFLILGVSLLLPRTRGSLRFHVAHLFSFAILIINFMAILGYLYLQLSPSNPNAFYTPLGLAVNFVLLSAAILLRSPARGLMGMFTTDSISSTFALGLLVINIIITFVLGIITLIGMRIGIYSSYEATAVLVLLLIVVSVALAWINIKLLYRFELERFVMKEELRVHNIDLRLGNEDLTNKMSELQEKNKEYSDKLRNQEKYKDITASLG